MSAIKFLLSLKVKVEKLQLNQKKERPRKTLTTPLLSSGGASINFIQDPLREIDHIILLVEDLYKENISFQKEIIKLKGKKKKKLVNCQMPFGLAL